jgi:biotin operon repressor
MSRFAKLVNAQFQKKQEESESSQPPQDSQLQESSQLSGLPPARPDSWQPPESRQPQESSQLLQDSHRIVDLIASLPEVAGRLELPHQITDHLLKLLDPYEQVVYLQLYRLSWGFNKATCSISNPKLAERTGMPESTVKKTLVKLKAKGLIKKTGLQIGYGKRQGIDFWVAAPSSQLQRSRQPQESSQLSQDHNKRKALKENNKKGNELSLDTKECPDCDGMGVRYVDPLDYSKGTVKCRHEQLTAGK